jgi:hypothetical protein
MPKPKRKKDRRKKRLLPMTKFLAICHDVKRIFKLGHEKN